VSGPLALVGGDELNPGNEPQDRLLVDAANGGPAYVLATAAGRQRPDLAVAHARRWFGALGLEVRELPAVHIQDARSSENVALARTGRFFYVVGGDPGLVPKVLAGSPLWDAIVEAWRSGAALAGSSAGAMAMTEALGLLPGVTVVPHFERSRRTPAPDRVVLGIEERTAAVFAGGRWRVLGAGSVTVMRDGTLRRFTAGAEVEGLPAPG
jgi:cyanophycinase